MFRIQEDAAGVKIYYEPGGMSIKMTEILRKNYKEESFPRGKRSKSQSAVSMRHQNVLVEMER